MVMGRDRRVGGEPFCISQIPAQKEAAWGRAASVAALKTARMRSETFEALRRPVYILNLVRRWRGRPPARRALRQIRLTPELAG